MKIMTTTLGNMQIIYQGMEIELIVPKEAMMSGDSTKLFVSLLTCDEI